MDEAKQTSFDLSGNSILGFSSYDGRGAAIGEIHARPYPLIEGPMLLIQLAFITDPASGQDQNTLSEFSRRLGISPPEAAARHHAMQWGKGSLRWEKHTEFSTYLWEAPLNVKTHLPEGNSPFGLGFPTPGKAISGVKLEILPWNSNSERRIEDFDPGSLCYSLVEGGMAAIITDFRQDGDNLTPMLILDKGLSPARLGALSQRLIEIETYRTLAMLGLPLAQKLSSQTRSMEEKLATLTADMRANEKRDNRHLLDELTSLAIGLEADAAASLYRFGASRAYDGIVTERLHTLNEAPVTGYDTWIGFLQRRMAPAMRTCRSVEDRQANLSRKLTRATNLLRTWIDVELEEQNRDLLSSMDQRAKTQLRLQQTVEGLSVAAVSYYVVGLIGYLSKGTHFFGWTTPPEYITALAVPVALLIVWWLVRRIRRSHSGATHNDQQQH
ncbi:DUF3422 family protein [Bartonella sp. LJL80]